MGGLSTLFALWMYSRGWLLYNRWNHFLTVVRYMIPSLGVYWYDGWESAYTKCHMRRQIG
ncbi:MAG TPA: hypothetical protein VD902_04195 [Symbiobacteriaceae bacterium]|nr:hypothetical protein [Symbiobacteriaceae bacterium]